MSKDTAPKDNCICDCCNHPFCLQNDKDCDDYYIWWLSGEPEITTSVDCCPICGNKNSDIFFAGLNYYNKKLFYGHFYEFIRGETQEIDVEISHIDEKGVRAESIRVCSICGMSLREKQIPSIIMMRPVVGEMY